MHKGIMQLDAVDYEEESEEVLQHKSILCMNKEVTLRVRMMKLEEEQEVQTNMTPKEMMQIPIVDNHEGDNSKFKTKKPKKFCGSITTKERWHEDDSRERYLAG